MDCMSGGYAYSSAKRRDREVHFEAAARGVDVSVPADPLIDRAIEAEAKARRRHEEAEAIAIKEATGAFLNEQNPLWGMF